MVRDLFAFLCLLLVVQIVRSSPDPSATGKSHKGRKVKHDSRRDEGVNLRGHKMQTRIKVGHGKTLRLSKGQSKENDNFVNLEHVLFDREQLKKYVLDYLQRHHGYDQETKTITDDDQDSRSYHHERLESQISSVKGKHKHLHERMNKNHRKDEVLRLDHSTHKRRKLTSKQKSHHQAHNQNHLVRHQWSEKPALPIYYNVKEEGSKRTYIWSHPLSPDPHRRKKKRFKKIEKHSGTKHKINTKRDAGIESKLKTHRKTRKHENQDANKLSSVRALHSSRHHGESKYKKDTRHKRQRAKYTDREGHKANEVDRKANGRAHRKSNKRDFIAIVPPKALRIEGFDVEPVHPHPSQHNKRKGVLYEKHMHIHAKKSELHRKSQEQRVERKSEKSSKSARHNRHHELKDINGVRKTSQPKRAAGRKSKVLQGTSRNDRKKVSVHKSPREQKAARKSSVGSVSHKSHPHKHKKHDRGRKKSTEDKKGTSRAHRRKKMLRYKDSQNCSPCWKSLDKRKIPSWYDDAKFGIFVHWGVYSVPSFDSEWFWYKWKGRQLQQYLNYTGKNFPPGFSYNEFAPMFKAEFFDAKQWAELVAKSGARQARKLRYFVFTSKHHEGFTNWNSSVAWNWNSVDIGPHRNIVDELARAFRNLRDPEVRFGLYYSLFEWFNPHYLNDKANGFKTDEYIQAVVKPQLYDLVNTYKPDYLWTDGDWEAEASYWKSEEFLTWLFNKSPVKEKVVVNDRWGRGCRCHHGGVYTGQDRYNPGKLQKMKWENAMTIDRHSWGFRREANLKDYLKIEELIKQLASTVSCGGNLLMNIGPASDGTISPIFQERLTQMGDWLKVNGDAIYKTRPWRAQNDSESGNVWYTSKDNHVFAIALKWPRSGRLVLGDPTPTSKTHVRMLGTKKDLKWTRGSKHKGEKHHGIVIHVPAIPVSELPCLWAWVFKLSHVK